MVLELGESTPAHRRQGRGPGRRRRTFEIAHQVTVQFVEAFVGETPVALADADRSVLVGLEQAECAISQRADNVCPCLAE